MSKITLIEDYSTNSLNEGRTTGLSFAFAKKKEKKNNIIYKTIQGISTCKDYLNDVVAGENHKQNIPLVYGYAHKYQKLFEKGDPVLVVGAREIRNISTGRNFRKTAYHSNYNDVIIKALVESKDMILNLLHQFEEFFNMETRSSILIPDEYKFHKDTRFKNENHKLLVIEIPREWVKETYMISLCALLIRFQYNSDEQLVIKDLFGTNCSKIKNNELILSNLKEGDFKKRIMIIKNHNIPKDLLIEKKVKMDDSYFIHNNAFGREFKYYTSEYLEFTKKNLKIVDPKSEVIPKKYKTKKPLFHNMLL